MSAPSIGAPCREGSVRWTGRVTTPAADAGATLRARLRKKGTAPSFLVVGTRRGGSTALFRLIAEHPLVDGCRMGKGTHYFDVHHHRGWQWFLSAFKVADAGHITGEASPYYMFHPLAPRRIATELPDARLIAVLRNPVDRAWSHYNFSVSSGLEDLPFEVAVDREAERLEGEIARLRVDPGYAAPHLRHHSYLARGRYAEQLERLYDLFPPDQVLVLQSEALAADPHPQLDKVWAHLGLPPHLVATQRRDKRQTYRPMPEATRTRLDDLFRPYNERLYALPGVTFQWTDRTRLDRRSA
jgi:sulfotransferase family protein